MADALTDLALYSALAEQVYRRAREKGKADQPLAITGDGSDLEDSSRIAGQELINPTAIENFTTSPLTKGRFAFDNRYIYNTATGFVAMVTKDTDNRYTVTFRGTDAGDSSFGSLVSASVGFSSPDTPGQPGGHDTCGHAPRPAQRANVIASRPCGVAIQGRRGLRWRPLDCHGASAPRNDVWAA